jgi:hypothetical protein
MMGIRFPVIVKSVSIGDHNFGKAERRTEHKKTIIRENTISNEFSSA